MPLLLGPALAAAVLLAVAGAQKVLDPTMTVGALQALGWPADPRVVRVGAGIEFLVGILAVVVGGPVWWVVAASYAGFNAFVSTALRRGTPIGSCGCFGRADTPPSRRHLALNVLLGASAVVGAGVTGAPIEQIADHPASGAIVGVGALAAAWAAGRAYSMTTTTSPEPTD